MTAFYNNLTRVLTESTTSRTLGILDAGAFINCTNNTGTTTVTIPTNAGVPIPIGAISRIYNGSGGTQVATLAASGGVTVVNLPTNPNLGNGGYCDIQKIATDTWLVLAFREVYTFSFNWSGAFTKNTQTITLQRDMNSCQMKVAETLQSATSNAILSTSATLPTRFIPNNNTAEPKDGQNNATATVVRLFVGGNSGGSPGQIQIAADAAGTAFTNSAQCGILQCGMTYFL